MREENVSFDGMLKQVQYIFTLSNESNGGNMEFNKGKNVESAKMGNVNEIKIVTADFTTDGGSHLYGLPCLSADSLDPMDHFCPFDVSKIIPKNMQ